MQAETVGGLPKVVIPVHLAGQPCDMAGIHALSKKYGFRIIEDASHAIGGHYKGKHIGNCRYSDITVFSFHPVKIITTGEGGIALTNDSHVAERMQLLRSHGITSNQSLMHSRSTTELWNYQQIDLGFNYRMTDIQAALGLSQIQRLDDFVSKRQIIAKRYDQLLSRYPVTIPWQHPDSGSSYHLYIIRLRCGEVGKTNRQVHQAMHQQGISVNLHYIPVYRQPYYAALGFKEGYCIGAERYFSEAISLPMYPGLTIDEQDSVLQALSTVFSQ
jgi:dTDP-4-amino-4,6-dideoxygalactose transaminase